MIANLRAGRYLTAAKVIAAKLLIALTVVSGQATPEDAGQIHINKVRQLLPPHSALPPLLDLSQPGANLDGASRKWENRFTGSMGVREHADPGILGPAGPSSISTTTTEYGTPLWALPARGCEGVFIATPVSGTAHMAYNRRFVYSLFSLEISRVLKASGKHHIRERERITAAQLGGTVRFPSCHVETFLLANEGFLELGKPYLLFLWKPIRSDDTYAVAEAYLIQESLVFPINLDAHEASYEGVAVEEFEARVNAAIAKNVDTN